MATDKHTTTYTEPGRGTDGLAATSLRGPAQPAR